MGKRDERIVAPFAELKSSNLPMSTSRLGTSMSVKYLEKGGPHESKRHRQKDLGPGPRAGCMARDGCENGRVVRRTCHSPLSGAISGKRPRAGLPIHSHANRALDV